MRPISQTANRFIDVSIHASVKDATLPIRPTFCRQCFNPRICKRCDQANERFFRWVWVSIHASVKDATFSLPATLGMLYVSIHASVKDATGKQSFYFQLVRFNPRICKRCDQLNLVSPDGNTGFNPRICKRCDIYEEE